MILIPAIDLKDGRVVRLYQGKFDDVTDYGNHSLEFALSWKGEGAQWLHLVDLDGARDGQMGNLKAITDISLNVRIPVEVGGGIRDEATVKYLFETAQVSRVILGTKAIEDRDFLKKMLDRYKEKICVSIDCANGMVTGRGWVSSTNIKGIDLAKDLESIGLKWMVYTDIARDGTLEGPNYEQLHKIIEAVPDVNIIASGGISSLEDVMQLAKMKVPAAITGRAIYEGKLDFKKAVEELEKFKKK